MKNTRKLQVAMVFTLLATSILVSLLFAMHSSPYELTRTRNSFLAKIGSYKDFTWLPSNPPGDFLWDDPSLAPPEFAATVLMQLNSSYPSDGGWQKAVRIAQHLAEGPGIGSGIKSNTVDTYRAIMTETGGYCSDYTQVFNGIAIASNIPVREWGMSFDGYSGYGHAFNEVYDWDLRKWIFIDTFNSFYVIDLLSGVPLSVLEFRERLLTGKTREILVEVIEPSRFTFESNDQALAYYQRGADQFFLYLGNNVFSYDRHPIIRKLRSRSRALEQGIATIIGVQPRILIFQSGTNGEFIDALFCVLTDAFVRDDRLHSTVARVTSFFGRVRQSLYSLCN
jgi:hypothetical protein